MLSAYQVYVTWLALTTHFRNTNPESDQAGYNFVRSKGKIRTSESAFERRADRKLFNVAKFPSERDVVVVFLSYVSVNRGSLPSINDMLDWHENETTTIKKWTGKIESLNTTLQQDLSRVRSLSIESLVAPKNGYPKLIEKWLHGRVSIETMILLGETYRLFDLWRSNYNDGPYKEILHQHLKVWKAYSYFLNIDKEKVRSTWESWKVLNHP